MSSKTAKRNQKRREKKRNENLHKEKVEEVEELPLKDPTTLLKERLAEAKANEDHKLATKLRQDLWVLQDINAGHEPSLEKKDIDQSLDRVIISSTLYDSSKKVKPKDEADTSHPLHKDIRKLNKKLDQIENLKRKQEAGEKLVSNQITKLENEENIRKELQEIEELMSSVKIFR